MLLVNFLVLSGTVLIVLLLQLVVAGTCSSLYLGWRGRVTSQPSPVELARLVDTLWAGQGRRTAYRFDCHTVDQSVQDGEDVLYASQARTC